MTDKQLRSLSKIQMLEILHQQEKEIERLTELLNTPRANADTVLLGEIVHAAQGAAESYLENVKVAEEEKINSIASLEKNARIRYEVAQRYSDEAAEAAGKKLADMDDIFVGLTQLIQVLHEEFIEEVGSTSLKDLLPSTLPASHRNKALEESAEESSSKAPEAAYVEPFEEPVVKTSFEPLEEPVVKTRFEPFEEPVVKASFEPFEEPVVKTRFEPFEEPLEEDLEKTAKEEASKTVYEHMVENNEKY